MQERAEVLIATYHETLERLWQEAVRLHRCSLCTAQDLESKLKVMAEDLNDANPVFSCPGVCEDARATVKPFYRVTRLATHQGFGRPLFNRMELVSNLLCEAWALGMKLMACPACVEAAILYDIRTAASEAHHSASSSKAGSVPDGCVRCCAAPIGLV